MVINSTHPQFYTFQNVRLAQAPVGRLRFMAPQYPASIPNPHILMGAEGASCMQIDASNTMCAPGVEIPKRPVVTQMQPEDRLFLDI